MRQRETPRAVAAMANPRSAAIVQRRPLLLRRRGRVPPGRR